MIETGMILLWSGAVVDIPDGYVFCDGNNGTPNLDRRFVVGAGAVYDPGDTGGSDSHGHTIAGETIGLAGGIRIDNVDPAGDYDYRTDTHNHGGSTGTTDTKPLYYALAYIMKT